MRRGRPGFTRRRIILLCARHGNTQNTHVSSLRSQNSLSHRFYSPKIPSKISLHRTFYSLISSSAFCSAGHNAHCTHLLETYDHPRQRRTTCNCLQQRRSLVRTPSWPSLFLSIPRNPWENLSERIVCYTPGGPQPPPPTPPSLPRRAQAPSTTTTSSCFVAWTWQERRRVCGVLNLCFAPKQL